MVEIILAAYEGGREDVLEYEEMNDGRRLK